MRHIRSLLIIGFLVCDSSFASKKIELQTILKDEYLYVFLVNRDSEPVYLNKTLPLRPLTMDFDGIAFLILREDIGCYMPLLNYRRRVRVDSESFIEVWPKKMIGKEIDISSLIKDYRLTKGEYKMRAYYMNNYDLDGKSPEGFIHGSWLNFIVDDKDNDFGERKSTERRGRNIVIFDGYSPC